MARSSSPLLLPLVLVTGALIGVLLDRVSPSLTAQSARHEIPPVAGTGSPNPAAAARGAGEDVLYAQLAQQYTQFEHVNRTFSMVARVVSPAVVHIVAQKTGRIEESSKVRHYEETGSGVIVRGEKVKGLYVLTNNHVVEGASPSKINIFLQDGRAIHPDQVWADAKADIAVMSLSRDDLPAARFGNSDDLNVGDWVLAMGSPFGLLHSVSQGIISARGRHMEELQDVENQDFLQTDAAINPGNSGGPLVNMRGEVVGINNSIASNGGGNEGVGFSIPINLARWIMNQLVSKGRVTRGAMGIDLHPEFKPEDATSLGLDRARGAWVSVVHAGSPASTAGLRDGDVILKFAGIDVIDLNHLINMVSMAPIGQTAEIEVWRAKNRYALKVTVGDRDRTIASVGPAAAGNSSREKRSRGMDRAAGTVSSAIGVELQTLDAPAAKQLGLPSSLRGAVIVKIEPSSPVSQILRPLDVIYEVNGSGVLTAEDAVKALTTRQAKDNLIVGYDRVVKGAIERRTVQIP